MIYSTKYNSPIGNIYIFADEDFITGISFVSDENKFNENSLTKEAKKQLEEYFLYKRKVFELPLKLEGTDFQKRVWSELQKIPYGETCSYGDIAKRIGCPKGARAIGNANNKNKIPIIVPCHRVIGAKGDLVGYSEGLHYKKKLLNLEGHNYILNY